MLNEVFQNQETKKQNTVVGIRNTVIKIIEFTTKAYYVNMATNGIILKSTSFW